MIIQSSNCDFGIEYEYSHSIPYIHIRFLTPLIWIGDFTDSIMPEQMCRKLLHLYNPRQHGKFVYNDYCDVPSVERIREAGAHGFGESFDPFDLVYYVTFSDLRVHFEWKLFEPYYPLFPSYPRGSFVYSITLESFRSVVLPFISNLIDAGYYPADGTIALEPQ